ncbi:LutC/YkgG family protein [Halocatena halophila]|uniref:LutC/YkgG family protein n=1 Tax=Halocatena halophila TaxID=2814576 RepID=UPI002ED1E0D0
MPTPLETFESSLQDVESSVKHTTPQSLEATLKTVIERPAVGVQLPFEECSLADLDVALDPTPRALQTAVCGITTAVLGIATYGTLVLEATPTGSELSSLFPDHHIAVLRATDIVPDMETAFDRLSELVAAGRGDHVLATGPSATADMGSLVYGAHGPRTVTVVLVEE